jgi:hypothetical protein
MLVVIGCGISSSIDVSRPVMRIRRDEATIRWGADPDPNIHVDLVVLDAVSCAFCAEDGGIASA